MPRLDGQIDAEVIQHLERAGLWQHVTTARVAFKSNQVEGWMTPAGLTQLDWLTKPYVGAYGEVRRMRRGPWWLLHLRVGKKLRDYRSDNSVFGPGSTQVVVSGVCVPGFGHAFYGDVDSDSPNMDLWRAMKHLAKVVDNTIAGETGGPQEA